MTWGQAALESEAEETGHMPLLLILGEEALCAGQKAWDGGRALGALWTPQLYLAQATVSRDLTDAFLSGVMASGQYVTEFSCHLSWS